MVAKQITLKEVGEMVARVVEHMATKEDIAHLDKRIDRLDDRIGKLDAKIDRFDTKLSKFEDSEIDKRKQLEVRVAAIEKHLDLDKKIAA
jgi:predicted  nucleic acid-binding Zn-ribbon protein